MNEQIAFADYTSLVVVTDEILVLKRCQECTEYCSVNSPTFCKECDDYKKKNGCKSNCPTCKGTGLNPDQSAWWEALEKAEPLEPPNLVIDWMNTDEGEGGGPYGLVVFCESPIKFEGRAYEVPSYDRIGYHKPKFIHRPSGDNRPWPVVLEVLIRKNFNYSEHTIGHPKITSGISFAFATQETAPVFDSFGIPVLMQWRKS